MKVIVAIHSLQGLPFCGQMISELWQISGSIDQMRCLLRRVPLNTNCVFWCTCLPIPTALSKLAGLPFSESWHWCHPVDIVATKQVFHILLPSSFSLWPRLWNLEACLLWRVHAMNQICMPALVAWTYLCFTFMVECHDETRCTRSAFCVRTYMRTAL